MIRKTYIPKNIDGDDFRGIMFGFGFGANTVGIDRNISSGALSQAQSRKYYRQAQALANQRKVLEKRIDKLRKEVNKIHDKVSR